jgi:hypothetical protein
MPSPRCDRDAKHVAGTPVAKEPVSAFVVILSAFFVILSAFVVMNRSTRSGARLLYAKNHPRDVAIP